MSRVFVTGATGVLGRSALPALVAAGHDVSAVVRSEAKAGQVRHAGAAPVEVDLFDVAAVRRAVTGHDAVIHLATNIPTGVGAATKRAWSTNDRLRREASSNLATAAVDTGAERYVQESITFPYVDRGDDWIDETVECRYFWGNESTVDAEASASSVTSADGIGVVLRFAMFMAVDSAHMQTFSAMAWRGIWALAGTDDSYVSFVHVDDAASAVVAALDAPAGDYNVAEADPTTRGAHRAALATAAGRSRLRGLPRLAERLGGASMESLARSHRVSSAALTSATGWSAERQAVDSWKEFS